MRKNLYIVNYKNFSNQQFQVELAKELRGSNVDTTQLSYFKLSSLRF